MGFTNPYPASRLTVDSTNSLVSGMQAWFPLTEGTGTSAQCILHPSHTGALGSSVSWESSEIGTSVVSDGANLTGGINTGNPSSVQITGDLTIAAWVKCDDSTPSSNQYIVSKYGAGAGQRAYAIALLTSGSVRFTYQSSGNPYNSAEDVDSSATLTAGTWHFVVGTFQASTAGKIYIDGELDTSNTSSVPSSIFNSSSDVYISGIDDGPLNCFDGNIQNVKIYNRALSATEVATLYHRPWEGSNYGDIWPYSPPAASSMTLSSDTAASSLMNSCLGWWPLTTGTGTTAKDIVGTNDGTLTSGVSWKEAALGTSSEHTHGNDYISTGLDVAGESAVTVSAWVRNDGVGLYGKIVCQSHNANFDMHMSVAGNSALKYYINSTSITANNSDIPPIGTWFHVCAVWQQSSRQEIYVNGKLSASVTADTSVIGSNPHNVFIGGTTARSSRGWDGGIQNVRIWNRALSSSEVAVLAERPWEGIEYGDTFHHDPPAPASMLPLTSDAINTDQVGWWPLTETDDYASGAADISGGGNNGTQSGGVISEVSLLGGVASFDGSNDIIDASAYTIASTSAMTMAGWVRYTSTVGSVSVLNICNDSGGTTAQYTRNIAVTSSGNAACNVQSGTAIAQAVGSTVFDIGEWHLIVGTFNKVGTSYDVEVFVDGVSEATASGTGSELTPYTKTCVGGARRYNGAITAVEPCNIQNVRLWNRVLTADEIWSIYANPWLGSNYKLASGSTPLYNYIFRTERFRRLG